MNDYNVLDSHLRQFLLVQDKENGKVTLEKLFDSPVDQKKNLENY